MRILSRGVYAAAFSLAAFFAGSGPTGAEVTQVAMPADPVAAAAFEVLERNCARCHEQTVLGEARTPGGGFGHVLRLDELAVEPEYVMPGNPDGSVLVEQIATGRMPQDQYYGGTSVTDEEMMALRAWIMQLGETAASACGGREFVSPNDVVNAIASDLDGLQRTRVTDTRYITLTHLYNACVPDEQMELFRFGVVKLLNSLSTVSTVVRLETIDSAGTIIRFNLKDVGWDPVAWDIILDAYPYAARTEGAMFDALGAATLTPLPFVRGDWFAFTASQPPLYDKLLGLPDTFQELEALLGVDTIANINGFNNVHRAGFQDSGVSRNNRLIERHQIATGYFWTSYDFAGNRDRQSLFNFPLGPGGGEYVFDHDGGETIFSLPNGFQAYYLNAADGTKLDKGPPEIVLDKSRRDQRVTNGVSCMGCHQFGMIMAVDEVGLHVQTNRGTFPPAVRDAVESLYPPADQMTAILQGDAARFAAAVAAAGIDISITRERGEPINALFAKYENDVSLDLAAAEFGVDTETFVAALDGIPSADAIRLKRRLQQGTVPRDTFESLFIRLVENVSEQRVLDYAPQIAHPIAVATYERPVAAKRDFDLALYSDRNEYHVGDGPVFTVRSERACYLTLINVDKHDVATVIFPNQFQQDNFLPANTDLAFPGAGAPFAFRANDPGAERIIAICSLDDRAVDGIDIDYSTVFTDLGDYNAHLSRARQIAVVAAPTQASPDAIPVLTEEGVEARAAIVVHVR